MPIFLQQLGVLDWNFQTSLLNMLAVVHVSSSTINFLKQSVSPEPSQSAAYGRY